jgi:hypothetical protein
MKYVHKMIDLDSGQALWVDLEDHRPFSEVARSLGIGERTFRQVLNAMGLLQREWDARAERHRNRLAPWAVNSGLGVRHDNRAFKRDALREPFDVLSPEGVEYVVDHLEETFAKMKAPSPCLLKARAELKEAEKRRTQPMDAEQRVSWLVAHHANLTQENIAEIVEVSDRLVRRYIKRRDGQIARAKAKAASLPFLVRGVPSEEVVPASAREVPRPSVTLVKQPVGGTRDAWERGEADREEKGYPAPSSWQPDEDLLQVA